MPETKFKIGKYMIPVDVDYHTDLGKIQIAFRYNPALIAEVKAMSGHKWLGINDGPKIWQVNDNEHNRFQIAFLEGKKPYAPYDCPLKQHKPNREVYEHQLAMICHGLTRHYCIFACEMGTGKTLAAIEIMEASNIREWWYIAPKSALAAVQLEMYKWSSKVRPKFFTYEALVRQIKEWTPGLPAPQGVIFDECSKLKNPTAQRSQAARILAEGVRKDWDGLGYVILMSGAPAPKQPTDWYNQCQTARPGFLKEGDFYKFRDRLAIIEQMEGADGVRYPKILGWKDSNDKCGKCAKGEADFTHTPEAAMLGQGHPFAKCENEIANLHKRMNGLVLVKFKKDCLDLPEKVYNVVKCKPSINVLNAARLIQKSGVPAAQVLMKLRELSDGFQYNEREVGRERCPRCLGARVKAGVDETHCHACNGNGEIRKYIREAIQIETPKDEAFLNLLEQFDDDGRLVAYSGFTNSVDRIEALCIKAGWSTITVDGRGWRSPLASTPADMLYIFQEAKEKYERVCFVGHPGSAGMGLTLTASQVIVYYSNDFNAESRWQSEDRIHRIGSRGAIYYDLVHLPTDRLILDNLKLKKDLMLLSLGEIAKALEDNNGQT